MNISVQHITKTYKAGKKALDDVSMEMTSPNMIGLVGPNGAGKSTLMKLLIAELLPSSGSILLDNEPLQKKEKYLKSVLGYLPQAFGLYDELTVWQLLDYPPDQTGNLHLPCRSLLFWEDYFSALQVL